MMMVLALRHRLNVHHLIYSSHRPDEVRTKNIPLYRWGNWSSERLQDTHYTILNLNVSASYSCFNNHPKTEWFKLTVIDLFMLVWIGSLVMSQLGQLFSALPGLAWAYSHIHIQLSSQQARWFHVALFTCLEVDWACWLECLGPLCVAPSASQLSLPHKMASRRERIEATRPLEA